MFRLLGFLVGSFVSIAALVLLIGTPDFHLGQEGVDVARFNEAVEKLKAKQAALQEAAEAEEPEPEQSPTPVAAADTAMPPPGPAADEGESPVAAEAAASASVPAEPVPEEPSVERPARPGAAPPEAEWHSFWTPFRTEIAARGFVSRLESVTGLDYRILRMDRGEYQVAFSYATTDELDTKLARIASATGLDLSRDLP